MTLEEAISRNQRVVDMLIDKSWPFDAKAVLLGIEALQRCRDNYLNPQRADFRRLPSETKE